MARTLESQMIGMTDHERAQFLARTNYGAAIGSITGITLKLTGTDGNAFAVLGAAKSALREAGIDRAQVAAFVDEASSGDYDHLLGTCMEWFDVT